MFNMFTPFMAGRGTSMIVLWMLFFVGNMVLFGMIGLGKSPFGGGESDALRRPVLSSHLPKALPGWHRRTYLASDGEAITAPAKGRGLEARLAMGEDMEQFRLYANGGISGAAALYIRGEERIAIGMMRGVSETPDWFPRGRYGDDPAVRMTRLKTGQVVALVHGLAFERRGGPAGPGVENPFGYDRYVARVGHDLVVDVIANAPQPDVERLLVRIDGDALALQLGKSGATADGKPVLSRDKGVILHHDTATWPGKPGPVAKPAKN